MVATREDSKERRDLGASDVPPLYHDGNALGAIAGWDNPISANITGSKASEAKTGMHEINADTIEPVASNESDGV